MKILQLYASLLNAAHMTVTPEGVVERQILGVEDKKSTVTVNLPDGKRAVMVLPIKAQTDKPDWSERVVFHPLRENTQRGESLVMERYRTNMMARINASMMVLMVSLLKLASEPEAQASLSPDQLQYLSQLPHADKTTLENFNQLILKTASTDSPLWAFIKNSGMKDKVIYRRLCVVSAPLLEAILAAEDRKVKGVKLRISDVNTFKALYALLMPQIKGSDMTFYSHGSNSVRAPSLDAFMGAVKKIAENIDNVASIFASAVPDLADNIMFDMLWTEVFENIDAYSPTILTIPAMPGNEGRVLNEKAEQRSVNLQPWEPADAPPAGMREPLPAAAEKPTIITNPDRGYQRPLTREREPVRQQSKDPFADSPYYRMKQAEAERANNQRVSYGGGRQYSAAVANGYPEDTPRSGSYSGGYSRPSYGGGRRY